MLDCVVDSREDREYQIKRHRNQSCIDEVKEDLAKYPCDQKDYTIIQEQRYTQIVLKKSNLLLLESAVRSALEQKRNIELTNSSILYTISLEEYTY